MSLIVAEATADGPRIVSDTYVTFSDHRRTSFRTGVLKAIVLRRDVTVCFAGDVGLGLRAIREVATGLDQGQGVAEILSTLQARTGDAPGEPEFIVATAQPDSQLIRVSNHTIETGLRAAWIGDRQAFDRFREIRNAGHETRSREVEATANLPESVRIMAALTDAMKAVIADSSVPTVGDFCVRVVHRSSGFQYIDELFMHSHRGVRAQADDSLRIAEGEYHVTQVMPAEAGTPALGLVFPPARLGMLFLPLKFEEAQVIRDVSVDDYLQRVAEDFGVRMAKPLTIAS